MDRSLSEGSAADSASDVELAHLGRRTGAFVLDIILLLFTLLIGWLVVQHLSIEGCRRLGRGGLETRPVVVGRRSNHW